MAEEEHVPVEDGGAPPKKRGVLSLDGIQDKDLRALDKDGDGVIDEDEMRDGEYHFEYNFFSTTRTKPFSAFEIASLALLTKRRYRPARFPTKRNFN